MHLQAYSSGTLCKNEKTHSWSFMLILNITVQFSPSIYSETAYLFRTRQKRQVFINNELLMKGSTKENSDPVVECVGLFCVPIYFCNASPFKSCSISCLFEAPTHISQLTFSSRMSEEASESGPLKLGGTNPV